LVAGNVAGQVRLGYVAGNVAGQENGNGEQKIEFVWLDKN
jgi:hypothetical protein